MGETVFDKECGSATSGIVSSIGKVTSIVAQGGCSWGLQIRLANTKNVIITI